jgi:hypothetical protein
MKPKPAGLDFEEVDVRRILRPASHAKYIHEPAYDSVVYIHRRDGLVPLSSLCKNAKTVLSASVRLLQGRNGRHGKPKLFVREKGRLIAIGGSRSVDNGDIEVIRVPKLFPDRKEDFVPFEMDEEYVRFAVRAVAAPKTNKVDIRLVKKWEKAKKMEQAASETSTAVALSDKNIVSQLFNKFQAEGKDEKSTECREEESQAESAACDVPASAAVPEDEIFKSGAQEEEEVKCKLAIVLDSKLDESVSQSGEEAAKPAEQASDETTNGDASSTVGKDDIEKVSEETAASQVRHFFISLGHAKPSLLLYCD